jgi:acyl phosphate:glycerol-3-phosphate acyltransferase
LNPLVVYLALLVGAYLMGSIPFGIIIGRAFFGVDPRTVGSGNIGTANSMRAFGAGGAALVLACDVLKGVIPTYVATRLLGEPSQVVEIGLAAIVGHNWSAFLRFGGGKGVATTLGVVMVLSLPAAAVFGAVWLAVAAITRYSSLASMLGSVAIPVAMFALGRPMPYVHGGIIAALLVILRHLDNIKRLADGTERKIGTKKQP